MQNEQTKIIVRTCRSEATAQKEFASEHVKRLPDSDPLLPETKRLIVLADAILEMKVDSRESLTDILHKQSELRELSGNWRRSLVERVMPRSKE